MYKEKQKVTTVETEHQPFHFNGDKLVPGVRWPKVSEPDKHQLQIRTLRVSGSIPTQRLLCPLVWREKRTVCLSLLRTRQACPTRVLQSGRASRPRELEIKKGFVREEGRGGSGGGEVVYLKNFLFLNTSRLV